MASPPNSTNIFWNIFAPLFIRTIAEIKQNLRFPAHMNTAVISLLPNPNKDPTPPSNNCPFSVINVDRKTQSQPLQMQKMLLTENWKFSLYCKNLALGYLLLIGSRSCSMHLQPQLSPMKLHFIALHCKEEQGEDVHFPHLYSLFSLNPNHSSEPPHHRNPFISNAS